jgi:opacity protein-like surface antigen
MNKLLPLVVVTLAVVAPLAEAADFYVGAGVGSSSAELPSEQGRVNFDDTGYKAFVGYRVLRYLSVEASYTDFGNPSESVGTDSFEADVRIAALWAVGILSVSPRLDLYARLGYSAWDTEVTAVSDGTPASADNDGNDIGWGFGVAYNLSRRWSLTLDWENYELDRADEVTFTSVSGRFRF